MNRSQLEERQIELLSKDRTPLESIELGDIMARLKWRRELLHMPASERLKLPAAVGVLSSTELAVFQLLMNGLDIDAIADALVLSVNTAITHKSAILRKFGMASVAVLLEWGFAQGIYKPVPDSVLRQEMLKLKLDDALPGCSFLDWRRAVIDAVSKSSSTSQAFKAEMLRVAALALLAVERM